MRAHGFLLFDAAVQDHALAWCYRELPMCQPVPLLYETEYQALAEQGPVLLAVSAGSVPEQSWLQKQGPLANAVWLESTLSAGVLTRLLQKRLQVFSPSGQRLWLRLADARPLWRAHQSSTAWPDSFWQGIDAVWLNTPSGPIEIWQHQQSTEALAIPPEGIAPILTLDWPLLHALAGTDKEIAK